MKVFDLVLSQLPQFVLKLLLPFDLIKLHILPNIPKPIHLYLFIKSLTKYELSKKF